MRRVLGWLMGAALWASTCSAMAGLALKLDTEGLSTAQQSASQALLDDAMAHLPPSFKQRLDRTVSVRWSDTLPAAAYGEASPVSELELNMKLLPGLADGSAATQQTGRPHGTVRQELLATVLHELTHIYDRARLWPAQQRAVILRCQRQMQASGDVGLPDDCRGQTDRRFTLSDDPHLLDLAGWPQSIGQRGLREVENRQIARSPDLYETTNAREFVAVNMEYFLLDPSYPCRRPELFAWYKAQFGWAPAQAEQCPQALPYLNAGSDFAREPLGKIDPERVYEVDYLLAEANQNWVSRWGHSMLRLVICAPGRPRGPDCRLDLDQSLVLSYRAFVNDVQLSTWGGLNGQYPSRLFVLPLNQVIDEYTKIELRSLASVPLKLDRAQIESLVRHAAEMHWSYDGNYYFLSNNCAVETLKLLRSGTDVGSLEGLDSIVPNGLLRVLQGRGLADTHVLDDKKEALRRGYLFDSYRDRYDAMFKVVRQRLPIQQQSVEQWLEQAPQARRPWFEQADLRASAALLLLEQAGFRRQLLLAQDEVKQRYLNARAANDPNVANANGTLEAILAGSGFLSRPAELLGSDGYGLPQQSEWQRLERESSERQKKLQQLNVSLDKEIRALLSPERVQGIEASEANLKLIGQHLRDLHKASGGLTL
ncbi:protein of unknown function [Pseudomonas sp. URIL14HWK12:I9]|nr:MULTISPECIES: DUF4105 domain-containing protein [unclassified Pseudomonas]SNZ18890.1 protein of unknown function [Pseudomonas sp. URIL14HWK12:I9]